MSLILSSLSFSSANANNYWEVNVESSTTVNDNYYFSWLGCHSCLMIEQKVDLSSFQKLPLIARPDWRPAAKIQIAMQMMSIEPNVEQAFVEKLMQNELDVKNIEVMIAALVSLGVDEKTLADTLSSKELFSEIQEAVNLAKLYQVKYAPTVIVKGKYATDAKSTGSIQQFSETIRELLNK